MKYAAYLYAWLISFRLKTLPLAISAVLVGNALAYWQHTFSWLIFGLTLITASLLQILSNLANDYGDTLKGADTIERVGPKRGIHSGQITLRQLHIALIINIILCIVFGLSLLILACKTSQELLTFILVGLFSIIAAITYTVGKRAYGYIGLGDLAVLIFFGLVSVIGSFYLQTNQISAILLLPAIASGLLSVAVLNINNLRDVESDKKHNKRTLVVLFGMQFGKIYHCGLCLFSLCLFSLFSCFYLQTPWSWLFVILLPFYVVHLKKLFQYQTGSEMASMLVAMIKLALLTNFCYSFGIICS